MGMDMGRRYGDGYRGVCRDGDMGVGIGIGAGVGMGIGAGT